jgi:hypothetical protein
MHSKKKSLKKNSLRKLRNKYQHGGNFPIKINLLKADNTNIDIGTCEGDTGIRLVNLSRIDSVNQFNNNLLHYINYSLINKYGLNSFTNESNNLTNDYPYIYEIITADDIFGIVCGIIKLRGCISLLVLQFSPKGVRQLCYLINVVTHDAASFGTLCTGVKAKDVIAKFDEIMTNINIDTISIKLNKRAIELFTNYKDSGGSVTFGV